MKFTILTLFPDMFTSPFGYSMVKRAKEKNIVDIDVINIRGFATDSYKTVDDHPYGGGQGMILKVDVVDRALLSIQKSKNARTILLDPRGKTFNQKIACGLAETYNHIILICGHYEGVDERIRSLVDEQISLGDFITTGGELPAMVIVDAVTRLLPGVLSSKESHTDESFSQKLLEYPQYTRPEEYKGQKVPEILLSGNHKKIAKWKVEKSVEVTKKNRPDLLDGKE